MYPFFQYAFITDIYISRSRQSIPKTFNKNKSLLSTLENISLIEMIKHLC